MPGGGRVVGLGGFWELGRRLLGEEVWIRRCIREGGGGGTAAAAPKSWPASMETSRASESVRSMGVRKTSYILLVLIGPFAFKINCRSYEYCERRHPRDLRRALVRRMIKLDNGPLPICYLIVSLPSFPPPESL